MLFFVAAFGRLTLNAHDAALRLPLQNAVPLLRPNIPSRPSLPLRRAVGAPQSRVPVACPYIICVEAPANTVIGSPSCTPCLRFPPKNTVFGSPFRIPRYLCPSKSACRGAPPSLSLQSPVCCRKEKPFETFGKVHIGLARVWFSQVTVMTWS